MAKKVRQSPKRTRTPPLRVPGWYYVLLAGIALAGVTLIVYSMRNPTFKVEGMTEEGDFPQGSPDAPVTMIEWGRFTCSHCLDFVRETKPLIAKEYVETGRVRYIYRPYLADYATNYTERIGAEALYCAGEQGKFWEMETWLYENVERWISADDTLPFLVRETTAALQLDAGRLEQCLRQERYYSRIQAIYEDAVRRGVRGTPSFVIGDIPLVGNWPYETFRETIEEALSR